MKVFKRNIVIVTVLLFVCVAVYLNWSYSKDVEDGAEANANITTDVNGEVEDTSGAGGMYYEAENVMNDTEDTSENEYFDTARLTRQQARDSATALLQEAAATEDASQETIDAAIEEITVMAGYSVQEAEIETQLLAKGFTDCVVFISADEVKVAVPAPAEGLSSSSVAQITDTVLSECDVTAEQIKIIEVK